MEWREQILKDLLLVPIRNGLTKPSAIRGKGVKMIGMKEIFAMDYIRSVDMDRVPVTEREYSTSAICENDLLFARQSLILEGAGKCSIVTEVNEPTVFESHLIRVRIDSKKANPYFIYYYFRSSIGRNKIMSLVQQVAAAGIRGKELIELCIEIPNLEEQNRIADALKSLDDKIEINNSINRNLEKQANALFKSWFIDFEPFGGVMPDTWKEGKLGDIASFNQRRVGPKFTHPIQYLDTGHLTEGVVEGYQRFNPDDKIPSSARRYVGEGDILFSLCRPNMRHYGLMMDPPSNIVASTGFAVISACWSGYRYYIYQWLKQDSIIDNIHAVAEQSSTTYPTIDVDYLAGMDIIIPSIEDTEKYALLCRDLYSMMENNYQENQRLAALRDTLLPKLMKGEAIV